MADNTQLNTGSGGDTIRTEDRTTYKTPVSLIDVGGVASEALIGDAGVFMPVEGAAAENAAAAGNPILVGGRYDASPRTLGDADVGAIALDADGAVHISDGGNAVSVDWNGTAPPIGAGTEAAALRVTVATNSTGVLSIDDNGASLTVDNAALSVTGGGTEATALRVTLANDSTGTLTVDNAGTFAVQLDDVVYVDDADWTDSTSKHLLVGGLYQSAEQTITDGDVGPLSVDSNGRLKISIEADNAGIGGGTQYTEDAAAASNPVGNAVVLVRQDTPAGLVSADGDNVAQRATNFGAAFCQILDSSGNFIDSFGGGTQYAVDTALGATPTGTLAVAIRDDSLSALTPVEGDAVGLRTNANGALWVAGAANSGVDIGDVDVTSVIPGTGATNLGKAEDAAHTTGDTGVQVLAVRQDTLATLADTDNDYTPLLTNSDGELYVTGTADKVSTNNSTTTPLGISGTFVGTGDDVLHYAAITIQLYADQASTADGMKFQFSSDNSNWDDSYSFTMAAAETRRFQFPVTARYFRLNYTNGGTGQSAFRVQTILHRQTVRTSIHRIEDNVSTDRSAELVKSAIIAQVNGSGDFIPVQANASGVLKVGGSLEIDTWSAGTLTVDLGANNDVQGDIAHDTADSGNPLKVGYKAIAHGSNPTAVAAADRTDGYANRHGIPFFIGGHPNVISRAVTVLDSDGAQTNASLVGTIGAGTKVVLTKIAAICDNANTVDVQCRIGFGSASVPAATLAGTNGIVIDHPGIAAGSGVAIGDGSAIIAVGGDGEELRLTCEDPVTGSLVITFSYFTIES